LVYQEEFRIPEISTDHYSSCVAVLRFLLRVLHVEDGLTVGLVWYLSEFMPEDLQEQLDQYKKKVRVHSS
jgi:hypothetical protein